MVLKAAFYLSLRASQGLLDSPMQLLSLDLPVLDYSTVSRQQGLVSGALSLGANDRPRHLVAALVYE